MRWDNLTIEAEQGEHLPGFADPATVRTFDAPEALGIRFLEVNARSGINAVPKRSRMPFRYTINPYRGCTHACTYCIWGGTPILMADGGLKPIERIRVGDVIYGTARQGHYRRYTTSAVRAKWATRKLAYRLLLEDGTELVASGDHRFLTGRGWKFVTGAQQGVARRPHLTLNDELMGTGRFASPPEDTPGYRHGYVCGMVRGDAHLGTHRYARNGRDAVVHQFRLALTDLDALRRTRDYLRDEGVLTGERAFQAATSKHRAIRAIVTQSRAEVDRVRDLIEWPLGPDPSWMKGFLAGIFDAEGSRARDVIRIANTDPAIIEWTSRSLRALGFDSVVERTRHANGLAYVRLLGGLGERQRFLHTVDPAISRKRSIEGLALKSNSRLGIVSIEAIGEMKLYDITTGTGDFIANGVVSHNCFARPTHTYLDLDAREDFERKIVVKVNVPELVRAELGRRTWKGDHVALGTNTDPYQWVESRYELLPGIWQAMRDFANPCSVLTKSPLLLRDLPLFRELVKVTDFAANLSIPTIDEKAWRATEPHTPHPRKRLEAVAELVRAGIPTGVLVAPLIPGVNDDPKQVEEIVGAAGEAGARSIAGVALHLRGEVRDIWFDWLRQYRPDLVPFYEEIFARGAYMRNDERRRLQSLVRPPRGARRRARDVGRSARGAASARSEPNGGSEQVTLF